jgi:hypothetical protein
MEIPPLVVVGLQFVIGTILGSDGKISDGMDRLCYEKCCVTGIASSWYEVQETPT